MCFANLEQIELHLLRYHKARLDYIQHYETHIKTTNTLISKTPLQQFSDPWDSKGYGGKPISDDLITSVYVGFCDRSRNSESDDYLRTLTGK